MLEDAKIKEVHLDIQGKVTAPLLCISVSKGGTQILSPTFPFYLIYYSTCIKYSMISL